MQLLAHRRGVSGRDHLPTSVEQPLLVRQPRLLVHGVLWEPPLLGVSGSREAGPAREGIT